jgi:hypothetical protein
LERGGLGHFVGAGLVGRRVGSAIGLAYEGFGKKVSFDFVAANVGKHMAVHLDTGTEHLAALFDHFLALKGVVDDVPVFEREIVFAHDRADTLAPAAGGFQVSDNLRFIHKTEISL